MILVVAAANGGELSGDVTAGSLAIGVGIEGLCHLAGAFGNIVGGTLSDRLGRTQMIRIVSCASLACSFSFGWMVVA